MGGNIDPDLRAEAYLAKIAKEPELFVPKPKKHRKYYRGYQKPKTEEERLKRNAYIASWRKKRQERYKKLEKMADLID